MTVDLKDIISISGYSGLSKVISPTRYGLLIESLDEHKRRSVKYIQSHRIAKLEDISIYTTDKQKVLPLATIFERLHAAFAGPLPLASYNTPEALQKLMVRIAPEHDTKRVHASYNKKIMHWYCLLSKHAPTLFHDEGPTAPSDTAP